MIYQNKGFSRIDRIRKQVLHELAQLICTNLKDPRISRVVLTDVTVTKDCAHAKVYYTILAGEPSEATQAALQNAVGYFRSKLSQRIALFNVPQLHFVYDRSIEQGAMIDRLLENIKQENVSLSDGSGSMDPQC